MNTRVITCRNCGEPRTVSGPGMFAYCSDACRVEARRAQWRRKESQRVRPPEPVPAVATGERWERTCPSCKVRHRIPRTNLPSDLVIAVPLDRRQMRALYSLAGEFIEAAGGEALATDEGCETCGRWSIVAFLDWVAVDVKRQEEAA